MEKTRITLIHTDRKQGHNVLATTESSHYPLLGKQGHDVLAITEGSNCPLLVKRGHHVLAITESSYYHLSSLFENSGIMKSLLQNVYEVNSLL